MNRSQCHATNARPATKDICTCKLASKESKYRSNVFGWAEMVHSSIVDAKYSDATKSRGGTKAYKSIFRSSAVAQTARTAITKKLLKPRNENHAINFRSEERR